MLFIQVTLISSKGYRPMSTLITVASVNDFIQNKADYQQKAATAICAKRGMTTKDLEKYGYDGIKCRVYDKERLADRYAKLKGGKC